MSSKHPLRESYPEYDPVDPDFLDEYRESTVPEARFDPYTIQMLVVEAIPKHAAYGMMFDEYQKQRNRLATYDTSDKKRLSFYLPSYHGRVAGDLAIINETSQYRFMILIIELGLITFQYDYHDDYTTIRDGRREIFTNLTSDKNNSLYMQLEAHSIDMCSGSGMRHGKSKNYVPSVPEWLYNAITDVAANLNMSTSDFTYLCWCIGASNALPEDIIPEMVGREFSAIISKFQMNLEGYLFQVKSTLERMVQPS